VRLAVLDAAAEDYWLAAAWVPPERVPAAVAAAESATVIQDSGLLVETPQQATVPPPEVLYLQISRTQNPEWAELLTRQLKDGGHPASVLPPGEPEDGYRVIVGPYPNREAAESAGKLLGRAYFLLRLPARRP
jgi:cell division septation protein DedD